MVTIFKNYIRDFQKFLFQVSKKKIATIFKNYRYDFWKHRFYFRKISPQVFENYRFEFLKILPRLPKNIATIFRNYRYDFWNYRCDFRNTLLIEIWTPPSQESVTNFVISLQFSNIATILDKIFYKNQITNLWPSSVRLTTSWYVLKQKK